MNCSLVTYNLEYNVEEVSYLHALKNTKNTPAVIFLSYFKVYESIRKIAIYAIQP